MFFLFNNIKLNSSDNIIQQPIKEIQLHPTLTNSEQEHFLMNVQTLDLFNYFADIFLFIININIDTIIKLIVLLYIFIVQVYLMGSINAVLGTIVLGLIVHKLVTILKKMLSHEESKKIFFIFYLFAVGAILGQCTFLVTAPVSQIADQGLLLLYIYVTATLMLFLIFLALTTCESYLYKGKESENNFLNSNTKHLILGLAILLVSFYSFFFLVTEVVEIMTNKTIVLQSSDNYFDGIITSTNYDYVDSYYDESNKLSNNSSKS